MSSAGAANVIPPGSRGDRIEIQTPDGVLDCYLFVPDAAGSWPAVVLYMDAFGIRPALGSMATRLASHGYVVALPNLYYRSGPFPPFDPSLVFSEGPERDRFKGMIATLTHAMVMRDTAAVMDHLARHGGVYEGPMAALGYCMGGGFAVSAAGTFGERIAVAASFHGGSLATERPDSPHRLAAQISAGVYIGAAEIDPSFDHAQEQRLRDAFDAAGVRYVLERYPGAKHGFAVTGHPVYDQAAAERHWTTLLAVLRDRLQPGGTS